MDEMNFTSLPVLPVVKITLEEYRKIVDYPGWNFYSQAFIRTRSYEQGLNGASRLIELTYEFKDMLSQREYNVNMVTLLSFSLDMLDRLDRWEEYLTTWDHIRKGTSFTWTASLETLRRMYGSKLDPWIIREDGTRVEVHFLFGSLRRKELIEKKLKKLREGGKLGNMVHRKREELSDEDVQQRFDRVVHQFEFAKRVNDLVKGLSSIR